MRMEARHPPLGSGLCPWGGCYAGMRIQILPNPSVLQGSPSSALLLLPAAKATSVSWAVPGEG